MAEKRVSVRLGATGGDQVEKDLKDIGEAGERSFGRISKEVDAASAKLEQFSRRAKLVAAAAAAAAVAAAGALVRSGLETVDAQAKLAQSLQTTVESIQTLERAGELAGVSMSGIEQATKDLSRRLSQAASGAGPAVDALDRLGLSVSELMGMPLDKRVEAINDAIKRFIPQAEQAAVAGQLFGEEGSIAMSRIDTATLRQATQDVHDFGVVVSEADADQIERTNDAVSRLGLIWRGLANTLAAAVAPGLEAIANAMAAVAADVIPAFGSAIRIISENIGRLATYAATLAALMAGRWAAGFLAAAVSVRGLATALVVLRGALIRTGIGALIVLAGELVYQFTRLVKGAGGFGEAMAALSDVASEVWERINAGAAYLALKLAGVALSIAISFTHRFATIAEGFSALMESIGVESGEFAAGLRATVFSLSAAQANLEDATGKLGEAFRAPLESVAALKALLKETGEEGSTSINQVTEALVKLDDAASGEDGKGGKSGKGAKPGKGAKGSIDKIKESAERLNETMQGVKSAMGGAFSAITTGAKTADQAIGDMLASFAQIALDRTFNGLFDALLGGGSGGDGVGLLGTLATALASAFTPAATTSPGQAVSYLGAGSPMPVYKAAGGGHITGPGTSTSDSIPAWLSDGEYVVNARATARNRALLEAINRGGDVRRFASGGLVDPGVPPMLRDPAVWVGAAQPAGGGGVDLTIINQTSGQITGKAEESTDSSGRRTTRLVLADATGQALTLRGGGARRTMRQTYGLQPQGVKR